MSLEVISSASGTPGNYRAVTSMPFIPQDALRWQQVSLYNYLPTQEKCFQHFLCYQHHLALITASEPCSLDVKCKPLAAACDIAVNHKLFVCILLGKSLSLISVWHRNCYVGIDAHISRMLWLTFELTQNRSKQFTNKLLICFSVIPRSAAEDNWTQSHAQSHTRLPVADLVLTLQLAETFIPLAGLESLLLCSFHPSRHHKPTEAVC